MPLFMDFHQIDGDAITEEDMYRAHLKDVAVQNKHGLIYRKYYLNLQQKTAFCLMESPNKEACMESHKEAHGIGACNVIEVSRDNEFIPFMGEGGQNEMDLALTVSGAIDSGFRTLMLVDFLALEEGHASMAAKILDDIKNHNGNLVKIPSEKLMASFIDAYDAVACGLEIATKFQPLKGKTIFSIGLATGKPVDAHGKDLFEETKKKVHVLSRLGLQLELCMDLDTKLAAAKSTGVSKIDSTTITVVDRTSYAEIENLDRVLLKNLNNSAFNSDALSKELGLSKTQTYRKISALFGIPPNKLLSELRLVHAARALRKGDKTVSEIAYDSGFNSPTYFTRVFRNRFNVLPTLMANFK
ncbi:MAG: nickel-binding protein [Maribacter sp.]|uniref:nickel-binding protein n=1 Tax=Maribacter sp. TaxID=1897614 RepID=UPI00329799F3